MDVIFLQELIGGKRLRGTCDRERRSSASPARLTAGRKFRLIVLNTSASTRDIIGHPRSCTHHDDDGYAYINAGNVF